LKVLAGYRQFLDWKITFVDLDAKKLSPSISINKMWHQHILDNRNYAEDCQFLFGKIIYHDPDGELDMEAHRKRIANTKDPFTGNMAKIMIARSGTLDLMMMKGLPEAPRELARWNRQTPAL
jgi:hypothetical protein